MSDTSVTFYETLRARLAGFTPRELNATDRIPAAVLVPFFDKNGEPHLVFTKRTGNVQHHRGEICFPGGAQEPKEDLRDTALREMEEEIAVPGRAVEVLGRLDSIRSVSSYYVVVPYVGYLKESVPFQPNESEVEEVLEIPFRHFKNPEIFHEETRTIEDRVIPIYYYQWQGHTVWGLTARILKSLLDLLGGNHG